MRLELGFTEIHLRIENKSEFTVLLKALQQYDAQNGPTLESTVAQTMFEKLARVSSKTNELNQILLESAAK